MPTIVLGQDEVDCFAAWVSVEAGMPEHAELGSEVKVRYQSTNDITYIIFTLNFGKQINYGNLLLQALLEHWTPSHNSQPNDETGNRYFKVPKHTPVIIRYYLN